jgi:cytochrome bd ubiquinol oxidase subunit II
MTLPIVWFCLIAVLWAGYFVLEGFDFGVGMLLGVVGRDARERSKVLDTIAPVWDGNEVWLVVAAGATFAAFPAWYATMFSGFYVALLLVLVLLIVRVVSFEWRERGDGARWRGAWGWANTVASFGAPFVWGLLLANLLHGVPLDGNGHFTGSVADLVSAYTVAGGLAAVALFALHGATFLTLRLDGELRARALTAARALAIPVAVLVVAFLAWTVVVATDRNARGALGPAVPAVLTGAALLAAAALVRRGRTGRAFVLTAVAAAGWIATLFTALYPRVLVSHPSFADSLTVTGAAAEHYALTVITVVAAIFTPVVLAYQAWTYHVLRARIGGGPAAASAEQRARARAG